jgi:hypothetical protein
VYELPIKIDERLATWQWGMHGKKKELVIRKSILTNQDFWWLIGYLQGDGNVDERNGISLVSTDSEPLRSAKMIVRDLFGLGSSLYVERRKFPQRHKLKLAVFSRNLVTWLWETGLRFGEKKWNVPSLESNLFHSYLAGLFDAEGQVLLRRNKNGQSKVAMIIIHSANFNSLDLLAVRLRERGVRCSLLKRVRRNKPSAHYELRLSRRFGLVWFASNVISHSRLERKKILLSAEHLPRPTVSGTRV